MNIKLCVKCSYTVDCEFDNVPDEIAQKLIDMDEVIEDSEVYDWLSDHIKESDATDWDFDVINANELREDED